MTTAEDPKKEDVEKKETEFVPLEKEEIDALRAYAMGRFSQSCPRLNHYICRSVFSFM
jgi:hypothetical protein